MGILNWFGKKRETRTTSGNQGNSGAGPSGDDAMKRLFEMLSNRSPSEQFASGAVFDIVRQNHSRFEEIVRSENALQLHNFLVGAYVTFCDHPQIVGFAPTMVKKENNDTDPRLWNADLFHFENGDVAALCYMPIESDAYSARIAGIIIGSKGDGYYYCMLEKDKDACSKVIRNMARPGAFPTVGTVKGTGLELMHGFLECTKADYDAHS